MLRRYFKTVAISVTRGGSVQVSRYRTIEQGLQNCRNVGHSSKVRLYENMVCM